jgi:mono/diheme cytochrome c family protein
MRRIVAFGAALWLGAALFAPASLAQAPRPAFTPQDERIEDLPDTPGRDETFGLCTACHSYRLVSNQGMSRERWDETMTWMTQRHGMADIQGADRDAILDYLARHHPPKAPARGGGFRNPFAPQ